MKKFVLLPLAVLLIAATPAVAKDSYSQPGQLTVQAGLGPYWGNGGGLNLQGGVDFGVGQVNLTPQAPLDLGVAARVGVFAPAGLNVAGFGTAHFSWKFIGSKWEWVNHLESYVALGVQVFPDLSLAGYLGASYHFTDHWALFLEASPLDFGGTVLGGSYRF